MQKNNRLKNYMIQLLILGISCLAGGIFLAILLLRADDYRTLFYLISQIIGSIFGYVLSNHIAPGGAVNYYFAPHKRNSDEVKLDDLIEKYRDKTIITLIVVVYTTINIIVFIVHFNLNNKFNFGDSLFLFLLTFLITIGLCEGVKYLTSWWNIKKNWKTEFRK